MIKLKIVFFYLFVLITNSALSQSGLNIQGVSPNLHLLHPVSTKDTWYSIGRLYNINPKEAATYNGTTIEKSLPVGQQLKIPLTSENFSQNGMKNADEVFVPLYHTVQPKEWMYRISVNHNKVPIETLEKWNNISRDNAIAGTKLIVGYLKVKQSQSALATGASTNTTTVAATPAAKEPQSPKKEEIVKKPEPAPTKNEEVAKKDERAGPPVVTTVSKKEENADSRANINHKGGYFKTQYDAAGKSESGVSGVFKSTSGWNDGKYYALMNNVPVGTIVRVNFPSTNKSIYAKVLGNLPDMKESAGLTIRISDAAATELGAGNAKFTVDVKY